MPFLSFFLNSSLLHCLGWLNLHCDKKWEKVGNGEKYENWEKRKKLTIVHKFVLSWLFVKWEVLDVCIVGDLGVCEILVECMATPTRCSTHRQLNEILPSALVVT